MKLCFQGELAGLEAGLSRVADVLGITLSADGERIAVKRSADGKLRVSKSGAAGTIEFAEPTHFYRAVGLYREHAKEASFSIEETPQFRSNGVMIDVCQGNSAMTVENIKNLLDTMAVMGLNTFYWYMEDTFEIPEEPYFGYLRGRYTHAELREVDDYAAELGITVIPCVQTLAHLLDALKWPPYANCKDDDDTLLVGDPRTYAFIRNLLRAISSCFRTKKIHIGMDEAWKLGQGNYLIRNGYVPSYKIMCDHLAQVREICGELGIEPMIWSDMFLKAAAPSENPDDSYYELTTEMPKEICDAAPKDIYYVYWDYVHSSVDAYTTVIERHRKFAEKLVFAGGIWNWNSFTVDYDKTFLTSHAALTACKQNHIQDVFATTWGDGGAECNIYAVLLGMQLFAEHGFSEQVDDETVKRRFLACTGCQYEDFREMTYLDNLYGQQPVEGYYYTNSSRWLMWQDLLAGQFDKNIDGLHMAEHYETVYRNLCAAAERNGKYNFVFEFLSKTADVLRLKAELGLRIKRAYDAKDQATLRVIADKELPELARRVEALRAYHRKLWFETYKPLGWEVLDVRYGGVLMRIDTAILRLNDYLSGAVEILDEVAAERLTFNGQPGLLPCNIYARMPSASRLSFTFGF